VRKASRVCEGSENGVEGGMEIVLFPTGGERMLHHACSGHRVMSRPRPGTWASTGRGRCAAHPCAIVRAASCPRERGRSRPGPPRRAGQLRRVSTPVLPMRPAISRRRILFAGALSALPVHQVVAQRARYGIRGQRAICKGMVPDVRSYALAICQRIASTSCASVRFKATPAHARSAQGPGISESLLVRTCGSQRR
jgi:hypothetical protein